jgi:hypothetical protein
MKSYNKIVQLSHNAVMSTFLKTHHYFLPHFDYVDDDVHSLLHVEENLNSQLR